MRLRLYGGPVILLTPDTARCMSCPVYVRVRSLAQFEPLTPRKYPGKGDTTSVHGACYEKTHGAISTAWKTTSPSAGPIPSEDPLAYFLQAIRKVVHADRSGTAFPMTAPACRVCADDVRSRPCPRHARNTVASARRYAVIRSIRRVTRRKSATTKACYTGHTDDRLRRGMTPEGWEARRRQRVAGMPRPAPVAARSFSEFVSRWDCWRRRPRDRPEGGGVSTSRDRNRGSPAPVREPLPAGDRVPTRLNGRVRGRFRGPDQARARAPDR